MRKDRTIQLIAGLLLVACLAGSVMVSPMIAAEAGRSQLTYTDTAQEGDPPEIAIAIAMGAFRGIFVNVLWIRAQNLKDDGRFHESIELARAITRLQPRFPRVWSFHAWNLAYNISVSTDTASERWRWVKSGIDLLRLEGIPRNPNDMHLQRELAWIFIHKVQGISDDANRYYKRQMALDWTAIMGPPPPRPKLDDPDCVALIEELRNADDTDAEALFPRNVRKEAMTRRWLLLLRHIESAPDTIDVEIVKRGLGLDDDAQAMALVNTTNDLIERLETEASLGLDINLLRTFEYRRALATSWAGRTFGMELSDSISNPGFDALLLDEQYSMAWQVLLPYVRKLVITRDKNMELGRMIRYTRKYGPLDWRHPASHAVYWATRGAETGLTRKTDETFDKTNVDRLIVQALQELFRWGDIYYDTLNGTYISMNNLDFTDAYGNALLELEDRATMFEDRNRTHRLYGMGYRNYLIDVVRVYYRMGDFATANYYFELFKNYGGHNLSDEYYLKDLMSMTLREFAQVDIQEQITVPQYAFSEITASLRDAFIRGLLQGDADVYQGQIDYASEVHSLYMSKQNRSTMADVENRMEQMPARYVDVASIVLVNTLVSGIVGREESALIWRRAPVSLRQSAYDDLRSALAAVDPEEIEFWFPEPPDMERYRQLREQLDLSDNLLSDRKRNMSTQEQ